MLLTRLAAYLYSCAVGVGVYIVETKPNVNPDPGAIILHHLRMWSPWRYERDLWQIHAITIRGSINLWIRVWSIRAGVAGEIVADVVLGLGWVFWEKGSEG